jgi:2-dehydro-3-deoxygalactonokinase
MSGSIVNCDWGTTHFRLRAIDVERVAVAAEFRSLDGVATLAGPSAPHLRAGRYAAVLADGLRRLTAHLGETLRGAPVLISGMASSSIGWQQLPYAPLPLALDGSQLAWRELPAVESSLGPHRVILISGACTDTDVMRGEETELVGLFTMPIAARWAERSLVILPGTHSKHLGVENGQIVALQTFMTGELFDLLCEHSVLRHSVEAPPPSDAWTPKALAELRRGVRHGRSTPLSAALFRVRTRQLLDNLPGDANSAFLSGLLLGGELAYLSDSSADVLPLLLCATAPLAPQYREALQELGLAARATVVEPREVELLSARGQAVLWRKLRGI